MCIKEIDMGSIPTTVQSFFPFINFSLTKKHRRSKPLQHDVIPGCLNRDDEIRRWQQWHKWCKWWGEGVLVDVRCEDFGREEKKNCETYVDFEDEFNLWIEYMKYKRRFYTQVRSLKPRTDNWFRIPIGVEVWIARAYKAWKPFRLED
jgi:hypothetical protein